MKFSSLTIAIFITLVVFSSCAKPNTNTDTTIYDTIVLHDTPSNNSTYYVTATINGVNVTYNGYTAGLKTTAALDVFGSNNSASSSDGIKLVFQNVAVPFSSVTTGFYTDTATNSNSVTMYLQQLGTQYYDDRSGREKPSLISTITAINDSSVSGTFSGTLTYDDDTASIYTKTITNGRFYVPF